MELKVQPKGKKNSIEKVENGKLKVKVTAPPDKGKANGAVIKLLSEELKIPKSSIFIVKGKTSREKSIEIIGDISVIEKKIKDFLKNISS